MLGKELRSSASNIWLNYAIPIGELQPTVDQIMAGKFRPAARRRRPEKAEAAPHADRLGHSLGPDFPARTPPFVESIQPASPAAKAGIRPDDLVLFVNGRVVTSCKLLADELTFIDRLDPVRLTIQRGQELVEVDLFWSRNQGSTTE